MSIQNSEDLQKVRSYLLRYARLQLRDPMFAEDVVMELTSDEICKELAITQTNLWVMLHRARLSLRGCLETKWFGDAVK